MTHHTFQSRAELVFHRLEQRLSAIQAAVPPIRPPATHWLDSESSTDYCWDCAVKARAEEFGLGVPVLDRVRWWGATDLERAFYEGIDGGFDGMSDSTVACETCGKTLSYILTDEGARYEFDYYAGSPLTDVRDEDSYALDRLCLNVWEGSPRADLLGACVAVNQAYRIIRRVTAAHAHLED